MTSENQTTVTDDDLRHAQEAVYAIEVQIADRMRTRDAFVVRLARLKAEKEESTIPPPIAQKHGFTNLVFHYDGNETIDAADEIERLEEALRRIADWSDAYPIDIFPEPDEEYYRKAHEVLIANGMTLDRLSPAAMRHATRSIGTIAKEALSDCDDWRSDQ